MRLVIVFMWQSSQTNYLAKSLVKTKISTKCQQENQPTHSVDRWPSSEQVIYNYFSHNLRIQIQLIKMSSEPTQASKKPLATCDQCDKIMSSKQSLTRHMKTVHDGIISIKKLFSSPKALTNQRRLFTSVPNLSTQGNSSGQVNDPKVMSEASYICGDCDQRFATEEQVTKHKSDAHDNANSAENDVEETIDNELNVDEENDQDMANLVEEYEEDMLAKELERMSKLVDTVIPVTSNCQECNNVKEVLAHKENLINNQDKRIKSMEMRQKKTDEKKNELFKEKKKLSTENSNLKTELRKSNDMLAKQLKKVSALRSEQDTQERLAEVNDSNQKIKCNDCTLTFRNSELLRVHVEMEHNTNTITSEYLCQACSQKFKNKDDLELHLVEEHEDEADCGKCNAFFRKESEVLEHANKCSEIIQINMCDKCEREIISKAALKKHVKGCHGKKKMALCRNGDQCRYHKVNKCMFDHSSKHNRHQQPQPQHRPATGNNQNQPKINQRQNQGWKTVQRNTRKTLWTCRFCAAKIHSRESGRNHVCEMHPSKSVEDQLREKRINQQNSFRQGSQSVRPLNIVNQQSGRPQLWCSFQERCLKGQNCGFRHFQQGFYTTNPQQNQY